MKRCEKKGQHNYKGILERFLGRSMKQKRIAKRPIKKRIGALVSVPPVGRNIAMLRFLARLRVTESL
jgi:hypothetical protein